ncbi:MAG: hypothetical protein FWG10_09745 [Eubacteriaceae bacterium]|nr:hypothetical protein [Eubacteriaceae bacterium]
MSKAIRRSLDSLFGKASSKGDSGSPLRGSRQHALIGRSPNHPFYGWWRLQSVYRRSTEHGESHRAACLPTLSISAS